MKQKLKITAGVNCKSKRHKISLTEQGKLIFHDHPEGFKEDLVLTSLGGEACKCYKVLSAWKKYAGKDRRRAPKGIFPQEFNKELDEFFKKHRGRDQGDINTANNQNEREKKITAYMLTKLFNRSTRYKQYFMKTRLSVKNYWGSTSYLYAGSRLIANQYTEEFSYGDPVIEININYVPENWYKKIYKRGIALVDGFLVLALLEEQKDQATTLLRVIALYNNGINYSSKRGAIKIEGDNKTLIWDGH